jgi:prevent-host-death family protein
MYISMYILLVPRRLSIAQARAELPNIIDAVEAGADVELTRRGHLVAVITSPGRVRGARPTFADAYAAFLDARGFDDAVPRTFARRLRDGERVRRVRV